MAMAEIARGVAKRATTALGRVPDRARGAINFGKELVKKTPLSAEGRQKLGERLAKRAARKEKRAAMDIVGAQDATIASLTTAELPTPESVATPAERAALGTAPAPTPSAENAPVSAPAFPAHEAPHADAIRAHAAELQQQASSGGRAPEQRSSGGATATAAESSPVDASRQAIESSFRVNGPDTAVPSMLSGNSNRPEKLRELIASGDPRVAEGLQNLGLNADSTPADIDRALQRWSDVRMNEGAAAHSGILQFGREIPPPTGEARPGQSPSEASTTTTGREGMTFVALPPAADVAKHLDSLANDPLLKPDLDKLRAEGGDADALLEQAKVDYLQDLLKQPGGDMLVRDLIQEDPAKFSALGRKAREAHAAAQAAPEQAKAGSQPSENTTGGPRPGEKATGTQATPSEATNGADVNKLAEPIAQVIREQDFAVAAARKAGEGVDAAVAARRKAIQEAMNGALVGLSPEAQADFVLNQLNGRLSQTDAEDRINSQRGRFVRGAFREMRFHFIKGRQEIRDLYKFINENPASMQGALIDAIAHGNGIHDTATEERMGNILLHIHNLNMGPVKRLLTEIPGMAGIARRLPKTAGERKRIAELQLQALSGQMSDKDLEKYKKGPLIWRLVSAVLGVVSPVAFEALSDATTQESQAQTQG